MPFRDGMRHVREAIPAMAVDAKSRGLDKPRKPDRLRATHGLTTLTDAEANAILEDIEAGASLKAALAPASRPDAKTWYRALERDALLRQRYDRARETRADSNAEKVQELAGFLADRSEELTSVDVNRARAHLDAVKWLNAVTSPKKYAPRAQVEHGGSIEARETDTRELAKAVLSALGAASLVGVKALEGDDQST